MNESIDQQYHICLIAKKTNLTDMLTFKEAAILLLHSFHSLGLSCTLKINQFDKNKINILLNYHNISHTEEILQKIQYIPYQLEQFGTNGWQDCIEIQNILRGATEVWDYSMSNINFLQNKNIQAKYLPPG